MSAYEAAGNAAPSWASGGASAQENPFFPAAAPAIPAPQAQQSGGGPSWLKESSSSQPSASSQPAQPKAQPFASSQPASQLPLSQPASQPMANPFRSQPTQPMQIVVAVDGEEANNPKPEGSRIGRLMDDPFGRKKALDRAMEKSRVQKEKAAAEGGPDCWKQYRITGCAAGILGCVVLGPISIWLLTQSNWPGFGVCFCLDAIASVLAMSFLFHPRKYFRSLFKLSRVGITLAYWGLIILTVALCFVQGARARPWTIILVFVFAKIGWACNLAAGFGWKPCGDCGGESLDRSQKK